MWRFRWLGKNRIIRNVVMWLLGLYFYNGRVVKVMFGPLKNYRWVCNSSQQFWMPLGEYEKETANWIISSLSKGDTFLDVGANAGYFTLVGYSSVGLAGKIIAFDPVPLNCNVIRSHLDQNKITNVIVEELAVSNASGKARFLVHS